MNTIGMIVHQRRIARDEVMGCLLLRLPETMMDGAGAALVERSCCYRCAARAVLCWICLRCARRFDACACRFDACVCRWLPVRARACRCAPPLPARCLCHV